MVRKAGMLIRAYRQQPNIIAKTQMTSMIKVEAINSCKIAIMISTGISAVRGIIPTTAKDIFTMSLSGLGNIKASLLNELRRKMIVTQHRANYNISTPPKKRKSPLGRAYV
jgi:hypothetical protein